jgi:hypothetical protein
MAAPRKKWRITAVTTVREALLAAAEVIERNGWCQGDFFDGSHSDMPYQECPVCMVGAINVVLLGQPDASPGKRSDVFPMWRAALDAVARWIGATISEIDPEDTLLSIGDWNDAARRSDVDVVAALRAAAEAVSER